MPFVIFLLALAVFAQGTSEFMLAGLLPDIATDLGITVPQAGLLTSAFAAGMMAGAPLMAALSRRWPPRLALSGFLLLFIAMHIMGALTDSFALLLVTRAVSAVANAGFLAVTLAAVSSMVPADRTARALAIILGGTTLALIAGVPGGAVLGSLLEWRAALWAVVILSVPALAVIAGLMPRVVATDSVGRTRPLKEELSVLRSGSLVVQLTLTALVNGATFCTFTYLAPVVTDAAGLPSGAVPVVLAVFGAGAFVGVWTAGRFGDLHASAIVRVGGAALVLGWTAFAALAAVPVAVVLLALMMGAASFAVGSTLIAGSMRAASGAPTMSGSFATASLNVGAAAGPLLGGLAFAVIGVRGPLVASAVLVLGAAAVFAVARQMKPGSAVQPPE